VLLINNEPLEAEFSEAATEQRSRFRTRIAIGAPDCNEIKRIKLEAKIGLPSRSGESPPVWRETRPSFHPRTLKVRAENRRKPTPYSAGTRTENGCGNLDWSSSGNRIPTFSGFCETCLAG
jgi:hypothetical protein